MLSNLENEETSIRLELSEIKRPDDSIMDLLEFGMSKLRNLSETIKQITDPKIRFRFQKWLFPAGLVYDGEKFGTAVLPSVLQIKRTALVGVSNEKISSGEPEVIILEHPLNVAKWLIYAPASNPLLCANISLQQRSKQIEPINYTP